MNGSETAGSTIPSPHSEPIAVIGLSCRLPGAADPDALWELLRDGSSAITEAPADRWSAELLAESGVSEPARGGFLDDVAAFDAAFFGVSPREAQSMDPQQRLALELGWEALENARIRPERLHGHRTGVYIGATVEDYAVLVHQQGTTALDHHTPTGLNRGLIANRLSYHLGLRGPSMTLDTAQSSSLVAVQTACDSLRRGDCETALAGGVHLNLAPESTIAMSRLGALSPSGRCHTFDARADGFVRGEGGGLVVLKPLARALADGDHVHAVIHGGAVNNDGGGPGLTTPDAAAQEEVLRLACERAGIHPGDIGYVELHGTGTKVGDPIEAASLGAAFGTDPRRKAQLPVGSVKTNIGHLEGAAGIAGLLKVVLCVEHGRLVPSLNFSTPHPGIPLDALNLRVQTESRAWTAQAGRQLVAGVSSFGMGGTNAHLVVGRAEELPEREEPAGDGEGTADSSASASGVVVPWVVSGRSADALAAQAERLAARVAGTGLSPADVGWSLVASRSSFEHRAVIVGAEIGELGAGVRAVAEGRPDAAVTAGEATVPSGKTVFVFPGQGSQWLGMGVELLDSSPVFAGRLAECEAALEPFVDWSLREVLRGADGAPGLDRVDVVQPVLWAVMVSLAELWCAHGVEPAAVVGHSQGEIAAACVAGALSLVDGARVVALRSKAIRALSGRGGMVSVALPRPDVEELIAPWNGGRVSVAAVNGPSSVVVSGDGDVLDRLVEECREREVRARRIDVDYASHSAHVASIEETLREVLAPVAPRTSAVPLFSTTTGGWLDTAAMDAGYWFSNLRRTVEFAPAIEALTAAGHHTFVEVSPHPVLAMPVQETAEAAGAEAAVVGTLRRGEGGLARFYTSLGELYVQGVAVDWSPAFTAHRPRLVDLPTYAFQRERHWVEQTAESTVEGFRRTTADGADRPVGAAADSPGTSRPTLDVVRDHAAAVLGHREPSAINTGRTFKDLGFDSVTAVELRNQLNRALGVRLPSTALYNHPSPTRLAGYLDAELLGAAHTLESVHGPAAGPQADPDEPIAIVAMACRYPGGVQSPEDLWEVLRDRVDAVSPFPTDRGWQTDALYDPDPERSGTSYVREGGFLDAASFDAGFFGISPREALAMDPQQRLLLETSWEALERAGIDPAGVRGSLTGVFVGAMAQEYGPRLHQANHQVEGHVLTGTTTSVASGRIAYTLGLEGPAITVDTACSSSLVALHLAAQALRAGECTLALAGGATVMSRPGMFVEFSRQRGLAPDGRCKPFAAAADGTAWGEGAGILLVERLSDARRNGHPVLAVLRGSATNQDGASNGLSAPNGPSQERVIRAALTAAGLHPSEVDAVEAHGTGTALGDPIEAEALLATYGSDRDADRPLWLGSLKSHIGHTQAAAGVAGVIKMVLALRHGVLPETLHLDAPSPHVDWSAGTVRLLAEPQPWEESGQPRRAGVSSFGISGTNAHVIVEQAPAEIPSAAEEATCGGDDRTVVPWLVHARTPDALRAQAAALAAHLDSLPDAAPYDVAHSLLTTRTALEHRAALVGTDRAALLAELHAVAEGNPGSRTATGAVPTALGSGTVLVFPGQGSQWVGMAGELLDSSPVFAERLVECEAALEPFTDWSLREVLRGVEGAPGLDRVDVVQPVLWAVMVSLAEVWRAHGVVPAAVVGHSQGEIAAACVAGALSLEDGARVVALRSRAIRALSGRGGMVSVALSSSEVAELVDRWGGRVSVAAVNGPSAVVVSGDVDALDELLVGCRERGVRARRIDVDYASHSAHVESIREELLEVLGPVVPRPAEVPFFSTVTGEWLDTAGTDAEYWYTNLRRTVEFAPAVEALVAVGHRTFVEVSPHPVLTVPLQETVEAVGADAVVTGTLRRDDGGLSRLYTSLGELYVHGVDVDWSPAFADRRPNRVELPTYAFQRKRFWLEPEAPAVAGSPEEEAFWTAVGEQDAERLAGTLGLPGAEALDGVLPALSSWHRKRRQRGTADGWRHRVVWRPVAEPATGQLDGDWLVVVPAGFEGDALVQGVREALAEAGAGIHSLTVDDGAELAEMLRAGVAPFAGVLSLLALDERPDRTHPCVPTALSLTLALLQALGDAGIGAPLWCVTRGAVATGTLADDDAPTNPDQAGIWGLGRVAALEYPERWGGLIDLPGRGGGQAVALLTRVLAAAQNGEDQLAVRGATLFGRRLVPAPVAGKPPRRSWRPRGTVLVTGGTGALGAHIARWLAANGAEHLVLTGRRGADVPGVAALCSELRDQGVQVTVAGCDIGDQQAVADLVRQIERDGDPVRAVVHAAGVSALGSLAEAGPEDLAAALAGKVAGADHLTSVLDPAPLDAVIYFSSISGTWGVAEHGAYAAANALLDARAERGRADGLPVLSVAWGPWAGGGMIADSLHEVLRRRGVPVIDPDIALTALQQALDHGDTSIAVADVDWPRFNSVFTSVRPSRLLSEIPQLAALGDGDGDAGDGSGGGTGRGPARSPLAERLAGLDARHRTTTLLELVREQVASVLGHDKTTPVDPQRPFKELGFDSLTAVELRNRLSRATGLRLPRTVVFDHPSPAALAGYVGAQLTGEEEPTAKPSAAPAPVPASGQADDDPIAIVSMACRYPGGVQSPEDLWRLVREGVDAMSSFPTDRGWDLDGIYDPDADRPGSSYVRESGFLRDAGDFDAEFFGISPREALAMDPQQRLLLETSWEVFERAGIDPKSLRGSGTGVYMGVTDQEYGNRLRAADPERIEGYLATGAATSVASGRVAYTLGLEGPAVTVDTACSSSLVALHMAVRALRSGECSLAVAGAAMIMADPGPFIGFSRQRGLARDGRCKPFSAAADGFALSEGVGVLLVERLSDARRKGHPVLAVVRGTAVNQDGASNGLTAPNGLSQQRVIRAALADAGVSAGAVDVVEAHGTGTSLGDPIEAQALLATYGQERVPDRPLWLGSVKSNIGHTQTVSGLAGVMKMVLAMRHAELPATLHADEPSPHVEWSSGAVELLTEARPWVVEDGRPRRAGVSSFGVSGTNAHVIVEQVDEPERAESAGGAESVGEGESVSSSSDSVGGVLVPWVVSGRSADALVAQAGRLASRVVDAGWSPVEVGWSLVASRSSFEHRAVVVGSDTDELAAKLGELNPSSVAAAAKGDPGRTVFVFPGQGSQWAGMAAELLGSSPVFAERLVECEAALEPFTDWSLREVLRGVEGAPGLDRVDVVQPVLWAVMVSLAEVWRAHGVEPAAVVGHSQGEIAAACVAGALSLEDGARVVALRSKAIRALSGRGGMVSVALPSSDVSELIEPWDGRVSVAAVNGPSSVVVSGDAEALEELLDGCREREIRARRIDVDYASHSAHVESLREELLDVLAPIVPQTSSVPFFSTVTGEWLDTAEMDAEYWYTNLRQTVEFAPAVEALATTGHHTFVEVSPHPVLTVPLQETVEAVSAHAVVTGTLRRDDGGLARLYTSLGELYVHGVEVDWSPAFAAPRPQLVDLPTYAFQRRRYWLESGQPSVDSAVDPLEARFWETVERADLDGLAATLGLSDPGALREVLPVLSSWRQGRQQRSTVDSWRYRIVWRPQPEPESSELAGRWLIVAPADHLDDDLVQTTVRGLGDRARIMPVSATADHAELVAQLAALRGDAAATLHVVSLLALDDRDADGRRGVPSSLLSTLALTQALADTEANASLWAVTQGAVSTDAVARGPETHRPSDPIRNPGQAAIWGLARVFGLDHPDRWAGLIDLPKTLDEHTMRRFLSLLGGGGSSQDEYAIRPSGVHVRRMVRAPLDPSAVAEPWQPRGTVLITGGTGALGAHVARALAAGGAAHLVLAGRRGPDAPGASELAAELTALGARVTVAACDVTDRAAVAKLLDSFAEEEAPLTAVVHTAGVVGEARPLDETSLDDAMAAVHAKVSGACHLDELLADQPLDAFVLFSSGAGVWGNGGQGPYAAANAALDALAEWRRAQGRPATSIAWGAWAGGGMVDEAVAEQLRRRGVPAMDPGLAVHALREAVEHGEHTLVVADIRWDRFLPAYTVSGPRPLLDELPDVRQLLADQKEEKAAEADEKGGSDLPDRLAALPEPKRKRMLLDLVRTHASAVLGHASTEAVRPARAFRELGFDSLTGVELRNRLNAVTALTLPATLVFDHPTPTALAEYLRDELLPAEQEPELQPELEAGGGTPVLPELQHVASALRAATDDDTRRALTEGLRGLLAHWEGHAPASAETVDDELADASDEDMFDLIDRELGTG